MLHELDSITLFSQGNNRGTPKLRRKLGLLHGLACYNERIVSPIQESLMTLQAEDVLDYYELEAELKKMEALASPSEAHGILCGQVSSGLSLEGGDWLNLFLPMLGIKKEPHREEQQWLCLLHGFTLDELEDHQLNFMPLLPDDEDQVVLNLAQMRRGVDELVH